MSSESSGPELDWKVGDAADEGTERLHEVVPVEPGGTLYVNLDLGSVQVESHDVETVEVEAEATGWAPELVVFSLDREGNDVHLDAAVESWLPGILFGRRVRVRARVPRRYSLDIFTRGGRVRMRHIGGRVAAETKGGSIELERADGSALLRTSGGSIVAEDVRGHVRAGTSGGRIQVTDVAGDAELRTSGGRIECRGAAGRVEAKTSGGRIRTDFDGAASGSLATSGGPIEVRFAKGARVSLDARTSGGRVRVDHSIQLRGERSSSHVVGEINGGGPELRLRTSGGSIHVRES